MVKSCFICHHRLLFDTQLTDSSIDRSMSLIFEFTCSGSAFGHILPIVIRASSILPWEISWRGDSGHHGIIAVNKIAGAAPRPTIYLQPCETSVNPAPSAYETSWPPATNKLSKTINRPRDRAGAISPMYRGIIMAALPTPTPITKRPTVIWASE